MQPMQQFYIVLAIIVFALALRSCRRSWLRKLGALTMLLASGLIFYFLTGNIWAGVVAAAAWFMLPWVELLTRVRTMRMPLDNRLKQRFSIQAENFPGATDYVDKLERAGYEHIRDCGWKLGGMDQLYQLYWNAETKTVATLCLCEQSNVTFTYLTATTRDITDGVWRTTNFPFSPTLKPAPSVHWNQVSCTRECAQGLLDNHTLFLTKQGFIDDDLSIPDPDHLEEEIEQELRRQIDHNLENGIIRLTGDGHFRYTIRGLFYLWKQFVRDMIRLC